MEIDVMPSILDGLNTAKLALAAQQYAMNVSQRNTANVYNPGYTRQDVLFTDLTVPSNWSTYGTPGVELWAERNRYLDKSISYELPAFGESLVKYNALREIDAILQGTGGGGLGTSIDEFFNSFTELSSNPTDSALRWQVISRAETMINDFQRIYANIQRVQTSADQHIRSDVDDINRLTAKIADLNKRIETAINIGHKENEYALRDERQQYMEELQGKINFLYFETEAGSITITTTKGDAVVLGDTSVKLVLGEKTDSHFVDIYLGSITGINITPTITSGEIGGYIEVRDTLIPGYLKTLNDMAQGIIDEVNKAHVQGFDLNGDQGEAFFKPFTATVSDPSAVRAMKLSDNITADKIAVAGSKVDEYGNLIDANGDPYAGTPVLNPKDGAALLDKDNNPILLGVWAGYGDNANAKALAAISAKEFIKDKENIDRNLEKIYASLLYTVGSDQRVAEETAENQQNVLNQLWGQRDSESGTSLNEEAINIIKYQQAYQANSRIVSVLNALSAEILNFVG